MKKVLVAVMLVMFLGTVAFAQIPQRNSAGKGMKPSTSLIERATGKVDSVVKADAAKGNLGSFKIVGEDGKKKDFQLIAKTRFYSADSSPITLEKLKKGDALVVLYVVTLKGLNDVISVTQLH